MVDYFCIGIFYKFVQIAYPQNIERQQCLRERVVVIFCQLKIACGYIFERYSILADKCSKKCGDPALTFTVKLHRAVAFFEQSCRAKYIVDPAAEQRFAEQIAQRSIVIIGFIQIEKIPVISLQAIAGRKFTDAAHIQRTNFAIKLRSVPDKFKFGVKEKWIKTERR